MIPFCRNEIKFWINFFESTGSVLKKTPRGQPRSVHSPANIEVVCKSVLQSPWNSVCKQAAVVGMSQENVYRILHLDLKSVQITDGATFEEQ